MNSETLVVIFGMTYLIVPILGLILLGMVNENRKRDTQLRRAIVVLTSQARARRR